MTNKRTPDFSRVGLIDEEEVVVSAKERIDTILADVEEELDRRGIPTPPRPSAHPKPLADTDITLLTNADISSLYTQYVAYACYIGDELAKIEGLEEGAKRMLRDLLANLKDAHFNAGLKGAEATSAAMKDPLYSGLDLEHNKLFFMKAILKRRYRGYITQAAALSRSIELRKLDFEQTRRDGNLGYGYKTGAPRAPASFGPPSGRSRVSVTRPEGNKE